MNNLRYAYAATSHAGLGWDETQEKAVDRVAAAGRASYLQANIWKACYLAEDRATLAAVRGLTHAYLARYKNDNAGIALKIVAQALHEYIYRQCKTCSGRGEMRGALLVKVCEACSGTGIHRFDDDADRARRMGVSKRQAELCGHKISWVYKRISEEDSDMNRIMIDELERV
jgi:hypothetical protein